MTGDRSTSDPSDAVRPRAIRVVVADDQDIVRDGLVTVLSLLDDVEVVAEASTGREAVDAVREHRPDAVLMDLRMPELDGAGATEIITAQFPDVSVLVLTTYEDDTSISRALTAGARGYLTKDASRHDIAAALRSVVRGQSTFDARVTARLVAGLRLPPSEPTPQTTPEPMPQTTPEPSEGPSGGSGSDEDIDPGTTVAVASLTQRELEVLGLIGAGLNNAEIALELFVSASTVKTHINNLFAKLQLRDRAQAVRLASRLRGRLGGRLGEQPWN